MALRIDSSLAQPDVTAGGRPSVSTHELESPRFTRELERASRAGGRAAHEVKVVSPTRTALGTREAAGALHRAWQSHMGQPPSDGTLSILVGQWAHETGRGKAMLNYNFGGIKGTGPSGMSTVYGTREGWGDSEVRVRDRFRAYASAEEGAADYLSLLVRRYPEAVRAAGAEDATGFVRALEAGGYFTGNGADYARSVTALAREALASGFGTRSGETRIESMPEAIGGTPEAAAASQAAALLAGGQPSGGALVSARTAQARPSARAEAPVDPYPRLGSFYDEVNRAALLMSALRIAGSDERQG